MGDAKENLKVKKASLVPEFQRGKTSRFRIKNKYFLGVLEHLENRYYTSDANKRIRKELNLGFTVFGASAENDFQYQLLCKENKLFMKINIVRQAYILGNGIVDESFLPRRLSRQEMDYIALHERGHSNYVFKKFIINLNKTIKAFKIGFGSNNSVLVLNLVNDNGEMLCCEALKKRIEDNIKRYFSKVKQANIKHQDWGEVGYGTKKKLR